MEVEFIVIVVSEPVESSYFIRAVVRAIFSTDTTVISHLVETFRTVGGSEYRTNRFAWRLTAMLTHHWLVNHFHIFPMVEFTFSLRFTLVKSFQTFFFGYILSFVIAR